MEIEQLEKENTQLSSQLSQEKKIFSQMSQKIETLKQDNDSLRERIKDYIQRCTNYQDIITQQKQEIKRQQETFVTEINDAIIAQNNNRNKETPSTNHNDQIPMSQPPTVANQSKENNDKGVRDTVTYDVTTQEMLDESISELEETISRRIREYQTQHKNSTQIAQSIKSQANKVSNSINNNNENDQQFLTSLKDLIAKFESKTPKAATIKPLTKVKTKPKSKSKSMTPVANVDNDIDPLLSTKSNASDTRNPQSGNNFSYRNKPRYYYPYNYQNRPINTASGQQNKADVIHDKQLEIAANILDHDRSDTSVSSQQYLDSDPFVNVEHDGKVRISTADELQRKLKHLKNKRKQKQKEQLRYKHESQTRHGNKKQLFHYTTPTAANSRYRYQTNTGTTKIQRKRNTQPQSQRQQRQVNGKYKQTSKRSKSKRVVTSDHRHKRRQQPRIIVNMPIKVSRQRSTSGSSMDITDDNENGSDNDESCPMMCNMHGRYHKYCPIHSNRDFNYSTTHNRRHSSRSNQSHVAKKRKRLFSSHNSNVKNGNNVPMSHKHSNKSTSKNSRVNQRSRKSVKPWL